MIACSDSLDDHGPLRLLVDALEQRAELIGGQEQTEALMIVAVDRHPDAVEQASGRDHDLRVTLGHPVVGDNARRDAATEQQTGEPQPDVEHDLDMDPGVIGHPAVAVSR